MADTRLEELYYDLSLRTQHFDADAKRVEKIVSDLGKQGVEVPVKADAAPINRVKKALDEMDAAQKRASSAQNDATKAAKTAADALAKEERQLQAMARAALAERDALARATVATDRAARSDALLEISAHKMNAEFDATRAKATGAAQAQASAAGSTEKLAGGYRGLASAAIAYKAVQYAKEAIQLGDAYTNIRSRLSLVTTGTKELNDVQRELFAVSQETRSDLESNVALYTSLYRSTRTLGLSQKDLVGLTKTINQAFLVSGASTAEQTAAVRQLGQALASGVLRGDEFNSIAENAPRLQQAVAASLGVTIGQLREMAANGKITAEVVTRALQQSASSIDSEAKRIALTVGGAMVQVKNSLLLAIGQFDKASGSTAALAKAISDLSKEADASGAKAVSQATKWGTFTEAVSKSLAVVRAFANGGLDAALDDRTASDSIKRIDRIRAAFNDARDAIAEYRRASKGIVDIAAPDTPDFKLQNTAPLTKATVTGTPISEEYAKAAAAAAVLRDRQKELSTALGFGIDTIEEINARFDLKIKLMEIDASVAEKDAKITKAQGEELKRLAIETDGFTRATRKLKEEKEAQKVVDENKKKNDDIAKKDAKETKELLEAVAEAQEKGTAAAKKDAEQQAFELAIIGKTGTELNALNDERTYAVKLAEYEAAGLDRLQASKAADAFVTAEQAKRMAEYSQKVRDAIRDLQGKNPFEIPKSENVDHLADGLAAASAEAAALARSMGEAGEKLAAFATRGTEIARILKSASDATDKIKKINDTRKANGQSAQGFGNDDVAATASIVGVVLEIANAFDAFGKKAKAEHARLSKIFDDYKTTLEAFNKELAERGLSEFQKAMQGITDSISELVANLYQVASRTGIVAGPTAKNDAAGLRAQATEARRQEQLFLAQAQKDQAKDNRGGTVANLGKASEAAGLARELDKLAASSEAAAEALKKETAAKLKERSDDLQARRLSADGNSAAADARSLELQQQREINAEKKEFAGIEGLDEYLAELTEVQALEAQRAETLRAQANAQRGLDDEIKAFGLTGAKALAATVKSLASQFPELAQAMSDLDLSTQAGLDTFRTRWQETLALFNADGVITDDEQKILDAFARIYDNAAEVFDSLAERVSRSLSKLDDDNTILGGNSRAQFGRTVTAASGFSAVLDQILGSVDLSTSAGADAFRTQLQGLYTSLLEGGLTDEEAVIRDLIKRLLGDAANAIDEGAQEAEAARASAIARNRERGTRKSSVEDADGVQAYANFLSSLSVKISALFTEFDVSNLGGIDAAKARLVDLNRTIDGLSDEQIMAQFGLTRDELLDAILALDSSFDGLKAGALSAVDAFKQAADQLHDLNADVDEEILRATGRAREADIKNINDQRDERLKIAKAGGASQTEIDRINTAADLKIKELNSKYAEQAASANTAVTGAAPAADAPGKANTAFSSSDITAVKEVTQLRTNDYLATLVVIGREQQALWQRMFAAGAPSLRVPALPQGVTTNNNPVYNQQYTFNIRMPDGASQRVTTNGSSDRELNEFARALTPLISRIQAREVSNRTALRGGQ